MNQFIISINIAALKEGKYFATVKTPTANYVSESGLTLEEAMIDAIWLVKQAQRDEALIRARAG